MKKHQLFFEKYHAISNPSEQMGFMRGYMLSLTPKQLQLFFSVNTQNGLNAIREFSMEDTSAKKIALSMIHEMDAVLNDLKGIKLEMA
jgi:hypothetical protein